MNGGTISYVSTTLSQFECIYAHRVFNTEMFKRYPNSLHEGTEAAPE